jgi:hypothetical protein
MELLRTSQVQLLWRDERICARVGFFSKDAPAGVGDTLPEALRALAAALETSKGITLPADDLRIGPSTFE